jgi:hypothetical protein
MEKAGSAALDLAKNEGIQNKAMDLFGMLCPYLSIRKKAIDLYVDEIEKSDLSADAKVVALLNAKQTIKKLRNQKDIANIAVSNAKEKTVFSEKSGVDEEWFDRYMESAAYVSSEEMQLVWGRILANEFEKPGSTPPNMTRILSEFTKTYAEAFRKLCSMRLLLIQVGEDDSIQKATWKIMIPYSGNEDYMTDMGLSFSMMAELQNLGVMRFDTIAGFAATNIHAKKVLIYVNGQTIEIESIKDNMVPIGDVTFSAAGETINMITDRITIDGFDSLVLKYLKNYSVPLVDESKYTVSVFGNDVWLSKR